MSRANVSDLVFRIEHSRQRCEDHRAMYAVRTQRFSGLADREAEDARQALFAARTEHATLLAELVALVPGGNATDEH